MTTPAETKFAVGVGTILFALGVALVPLVHSVYKQSEYNRIRTESCHDTAITSLMQGRGWSPERWTQCEANFDHGVEVLKRIWGDTPPWRK